MKTLLVPTPLQAAQLPETVAAYLDTLAFTYDDNTQRFVSPEAPGFALTFWDDTKYKHEMPVIRVEIRTHAEINPSGIELVHTHRFAKHNSCRKSVHKALKRAGLNVSVIMRRRKLNALIAD